MISLALASYVFSMNGFYIRMFGDEVWENLKVFPERTRHLIDEYLQKL